MTAQQKFFERVAGVTDYCMAHAGKCFGGWPRETVFLYVGFHALAGSIFVVRRNGHITAVGFAWACQPERAGEDFNWRPVPPGEAVDIHEVIGTRQGCREMFGKVRRRWPDVKRYFGYRYRGNRPHMVEIPKATMERFCA